MFRRIDWPAVVLALVCVALGAGMQLFIWQVGR